MFVLLTSREDVKLFSRNIVKGFDCSAEILRKNVFWCVRQPIGQLHVKMSMMLIKMQEAHGPGR